MGYSPAKGERGYATGYVDGGEERKEKRKKKLGGEGKSKKRKNGNRKTKLVLFFCSFCLM
jgi:hypothetical protein